MRLAVSFILISSLSIASWAHGPLGCGEHCKTDPSVQLLLASLARKGIMVHELPKRSSKPRPYAVYKGVKYELDPILYQKMEEILKIVAGPQQGLCEPLPMGNILVNWVRGLKDKQTWFQIADGAAEVATRLGLVLGIVYGLTEAVEPFHGIGCIVTMAAATGIGLNSRFAYHALASSPMIEASLRQRVRMAYRNTSFSLQYWFAAREVFLEDGTRLRKWRDLSRRLDPKTTTSAEKLMAGNDEFWPLMAAHKTAEPEKAGPLGQFRSLGSWKSLDEALGLSPKLRADDALRDELARQMPEGEGDVFAEGEAPEDHLFDHMFDKITSRKLDADEKTSELLRLIAIKQFIAVFKLKHSALRAEVWQLAEVQNRTLWWDFGGILRAQAAAVDRFEELLKILVLETKEPSAEVTRARYHRLKNLYVEIHDIYDSILPPLSRALMAEKEPDPWLIGQAFKRGVRFAKKLAGYEEAGPVTIVQHLKMRARGAESRLAELRRTPAEGWVDGSKPPPRWRDKAAQVCKALFGSVLDLIDK